MDLPAMAKITEKVLASDFTRNIHKTSYPAISPSRPELGQEGKTALITGGGTGIGKAIAKAFIQAKVAKVVIIGRRPDVLAAARKELEAEAKKQGAKTSIVDKKADVTSDADIEKLWSDPDVGHVDVLVLNSAKFSEPEGLLVSGASEIWAQMEANVKGPLAMAEKFYKQPRHGKGGPKYLVNVSTASIHLHDKATISFVAVRRGYILSKNSGTLAMKLVAADVDPEEMQVVSYNPGLIYTPVWDGTPITPADLPFDDESMPGNFAVWAASPEARFLHGRFVWASWDVEELAKGEIRKRIEEDSDYLTVSVVGLKGSMKA